MVELGPAVHAVGAVRGCFFFFFFSSFLSRLLFLFLEDGLVLTEILSEMAVKPNVAAHRYQTALGNRSNQTYPGDFFTFQQ